MYFNPQEFLELAERLTNDSRYGLTSRTRTAIGRAYYAAFLLTKKRLEELGMSFRDVDRLHQQVITGLNEKNSGLANRLNTLREHRVDADYEMRASMDINLAKKCVSISQYVIHSLSQTK